MNTAIYYDDLFLCHDTGFHAETARRLTSTVRHLQQSGLWDRCAHPPCPDAALEDVFRVHDPAYVHRLFRFAQEGGGRMEVDTEISAQSPAAALRAAGAVASAAEAVLDGQHASALCLVRPPGHHARPGGCMGFCLFNNVAVAAKRLLERCGLERVAILDFDAHHGNGTQEAFWEDPRVLFLSVHLWPFYPGSGSTGERGGGAGEGFTLNLPVSGRNPGEAAELFGQAVRGPVADFRPQIVLVSAGFDGYDRDPLAGMGLEESHYAAMTRAVKEVAQECCGGKIVSTLEGGYHMQGLPKCVAAHLGAMVGDERFDKA